MRAFRFGPGSGLHDRIVVDMIVHFNEGEGDVASDSSDSADHGRMEEAAWEKKDLDPLPERPVRVILDTDLASDCDDAGAVAVLHALADRGEADILAMGVSAGNRHSVLVLDAFNTWYGRPDIPIGTVKASGVSAGSRYTEEIAGEYPRCHDHWEDADDAPDVMDIYRKTLASEPDIDDENPGVVMVSIGYMTNFRDLLQSGPCEHSDLPGDELVANKVRLWVCM